MKKKSTLERFVESFTVLSWRWNYLWNSQCRHFSFFVFYPLQSHFFCWLNELRWRKCVMFGLQLFSVSAPDSWVSVFLLLLVSFPPQSHRGWRVISCFLLDLYAPRSRTPIHFPSNFQNSHSLPAYVKVFFSEIILIIIFIKIHINCKLQPTIGSNDII